MRDPERIEDVLASLRAAWQESPDLRLGQLVVIATRPSQPCPEVFHVEDDQLLRGLDAYRVQVANSRASTGSSQAVNGDKA